MYAAIVVSVHGMKSGKLFEPNQFVTQTVLAPSGIRERLAGFLPMQMTYYRLLENMSQLSNEFQLKSRKIVIPTVPSKTNLGMI